MDQTIPNPQPADPTPVAYLDCERLDCYRVALEFQSVSSRIVSSRRLGALRDQLEVSPADHRKGRGLLIRVVQMLTRLIHRKLDR